jgi:hypothetical protein
MGELGFAGMEYTNFVVNVRDIHNEVNIITKIIGHDSTKYILSHIAPKKPSHLEFNEHVLDTLPGMTHVRRIINSRTAVVPLNMPAICWNEFYLTNIKFRKTK